MRTVKYVIVAIVIVGVSCRGSAADSDRPTTHPDTTAWQPLFADDLSNATYPAGIWTYRDGILTASEDRVIWTRRSYDDFILDLEFKNAPGANSGVIVYSSSLEDWIPNSLEIQIADDYAEQWAKAPPTWHCGAVFGHLAPNKRTVKVAGQWNRCTITCKGKMVYVVLNGELITEMDMSRWTSAEKNPDGSKIPPWLSKPVATLPTKGHIGLQGKHAGASVYFRNVRIKTIDDGSN